MVVGVWVGARGVSLAERQEVKIKTSGLHELIKNEKERKKRPAGIVRWDMWKGPMPWVSQMCTNNMETGGRGVRGVNANMKTQNGQTR